MASASTLTQAAQDVRHLGLGPYLFAGRKGHFDANPKASIRSTPRLENRPLWFSHAGRCLEVLESGHRPPGTGVQEYGLAAGRQPVGRNIHFNRHLRTGLLVKNP